MKIYKQLYFWVLIAIVIGAILGIVAPNIATAMQPLGDAFIKLIKMIIAPIIFLTVSVGIAKVGNLRQAGRVGIKAFIYFEAVSTLALVIGIVVGELLKPGVGVNADVGLLNVSQIDKYIQGTKSLSTVGFLLNIIPNTFVDAFVKGDILQVLLLAVLFGGALSKAGEVGQNLIKTLDSVLITLFGVVNIIMKFAPIGAFGAMAYTIGKFGLGSLIPMVKLVLSFYLTSFLFVIVVLGLIAKATGFSIFKYLAYIKNELLIVLGSSSSEAALPNLITKIENLGANKSVVGLVIPTGYSFNLDGTNIYMTLATLYIAQATNTNLSFTHLLTILLVAMLTSKGASGISGAGFITLASTLLIIPDIPIAGMVLILGVDRFMSECRALTNFIGNGVAAIVIAKWEKALDIKKLKTIL